ncbi:hypothetical protein ACJJTC_007134 [Scirpophaga incertulas]
MRHSGYRRIPGRGIDWPNPAAPAGSTRNFSRSYVRCMRNRPQSLTPLRCDMLKCRLMPVKLLVFTSLDSELRRLKVKTTSSTTTKSAVLPQLSEPNNGAGEERVALCACAELLRTRVVYVFLCLYVLNS